MCHLTVSAIKSTILHKCKIGKQPYWVFFMQHWLWILAHIIWIIFIKKDFMIFSGLPAQTKLNVTPIFLITKFYVRNPTQMFSGRPKSQLSNAHMFKLCSNFELLFF